MTAKQTGDRVVTRRTRPAQSKVQDEKPLTLEEILEADDITEEKVPIPQWGGYVVIRSITERQMKEIRAANKDAEGNSIEDGLHKGLIVQALVSPEVDEAGYERMLEKSSAAFMTILKAIMKNSGLNDSAVKEAEKKFRSKQ